MKQPLFLLGAHKSGTTLLRSLFDGTDGYFAVPIESHFFEHLRWWTDYPMVRTKDAQGNKMNPDKVSQEQFITNVKYWIRRYNGSSDSQSDALPGGVLNEDLFDRRIEQTCGNEVRDLFENYMAAIYHCLHNAELPEDIVTVEKTVANTEFAVDLARLFPDAKFIHIIRNPYSNLVSIRNYVKKALGRGGFPSLIRPFRALYNSWFFMYRNRRFFNSVNTYSIVKYEELVSDPKATMKLLCTNLDLPFDESLLSPTYLSKPWHGNSTKIKKFEGITSSRLNTWQEEIEHVEIALINKYLSHVLREYGYEEVGLSKSPYRPAQNELTHYLENRFLLRYK